MIPDEAVEAAAKKLAFLNSDAGDQLTDKEWARELLEAAAPHLMAAAWDEGKDAVWTFMSNSDPRRDRPTNPYQKETSQ